MEKQQEETRKNVIKQNGRKIFDKRKNKVKEILKNSGFTVSNITEKAVFIFYAQISAVLSVYSVEENKNKNIKQAE